MQIEGSSFQILELPDNAMKCILKKECSLHWWALAEMVIYKDFYKGGHAEDKKTFAFTATSQPCAPKELNWIHHMVMAHPLLGADSPGGVCCLRQWWK